VGGESTLAIAWSEPTLAIARSASGACGVPRQRRPLEIDKGGGRASGAEPRVSRQRDRLPVVRCNIYGVVIFVYGDYSIGVL
jgi:hypothetical protein